MWLLRLIVYAVVALHAYLFLTDKAVLYWQGERQETLRLNPETTADHRVCRYYYPFGIFEQEHGRYTRRTCPRTVQIE